MELKKEESKVCSWCNVEKLLTEFYSKKTKNKTRGEFIYYNPECKECTKENASKWAKENPEKMAAYRKKRNNRENYREYVKKE